MSKRKFYVGTITDLLGDRSFDTLFVFSTTGNLDRFADRLASKWWGSKADSKNERGYVFDNVCTGCSLCTEVTEAEFNVLCRYVVDFTIRRIV
jgi:hypothetical protein